MKCHVYRSISDINIKGFYICFTSLTKCHKQSANKLNILQVTPFESFRFGISIALGVFKGSGIEELGFIHSRLWPQILLPSTVRKLALGQHSFLANEYRLFFPCG
jgi:hypothetical protein